MRKLISLFVAVLICAMWQPPAGAEPAVPVERHGLRGDYHLSTDLAGSTSASSRPPSSTRTSSWPT